MDFSILYRVLYNPTSVFEQWGDKPRLEPFIFIGILHVLLSVTLYIEPYGNQFPFLQNPLLWMGSSLFLLFLMFLGPIADALCLFLIKYFNIITIRIKFIILVNIFILCEMPHYLETLIIRIIILNVFGYNYSVIAAYLFYPVRYYLDPLKSLSPFLTGMLATFSLSFFWTILLWWMALTHLLKLKPRTTLLIVSSLVVLNMLVGGILDVLPYIFSKCHAIS